MRSTGTLHALLYSKDSLTTDRMISCSPPVEISDVGRRGTQRRRMFTTPASTTTSTISTSGSVHRVISWPSASGSPNGQWTKYRSAAAIAVNDVMNLLFKHGLWNIDDSIDCTIIYLIITSYGYYGSI